MRWLIFFVIQCVIILAVLVLVQKHQEHVIVLKQPPTSLAQWYKPQNKRQVWLHTMFKLRREMLAVELYANEDANKNENLEKWSAKLVEDYQKIGEMVPEWSNKLNYAAINEMQNSVKAKHYQNVTKALRALDETCNSCHADYRAVTATLYRAPDFSGMKLDNTEELTSHMRSLSEQVNKIKIGFVDGRNEDALASLLGLQQGMHQLGETCVNCHAENTKNYPNEAMKKMASTLKQSLESGTLTEQGKALGTLAVAACADCHATHRLAFDAKQLLGEKRSWLELLRHSF